MSVGRLAQPLAALLLLVSLCSSDAEARSQRQAATPTAATLDDTVDRQPPVDLGFGPGVRPSKVRKAMRQLNAAVSASLAAVGGTNAHLEGAFGAPITWPIMAAHVALLPDGRVMSYGPGGSGVKGAALYYDLWDPDLGTESTAHFVLSNTTRTNIFCSGQSLIAATGEMLITGGSITISGKANYSINNTTIFNPATNTIRSYAPMAYKRWYPTLVALPNGSMLVVGGRETFGDPATVPELFTPGQGWRTLVGAASEAAFGTKSDNWYYPRSFLAPDGRVFVLTHDGLTFALNPTGTGALQRFGVTTFAANRALPAVMFAPGKVLAVRTGRRTVVVDLNGAAPTVANTASIGQIRVWGTATVMADGKVLVTGGSAEHNLLKNVAYAAEIWDPATGRWTRGAVATKPRLYHSTAILLPDGSVLTAGGGLPGPVTNLNAESYFPPYLFASDGSGQLAERPVIVGAPGTVRVARPFQAVVGAADQIARVTLLRTGSVTHSMDSDQRFTQLAFTQQGEQLTITPPANVRVAPPGYYMLFVFNRAGTPSMASIISLTP